MQGQEAKHLDLVGDNNTWKRPIIDEGGVDKTDIPFHGHIFLSVDGISPFRKPGIRKSCIR